MRWAEGRITRQSQALALAHLRMCYPVSWIQTIGGRAMRVTFDPTRKPSASELERSGTVDR